MALLRSKPLLVVVFFLAIVLQGLTPFLHAHTGASSQFGLHLHVANTGFESAVKAETGKVFFTSTVEESPEVGISSSRQGERFDFVVLHLTGLAFLILVFVSTGERRVFAYFSVDRFAHRHYSQSSLPPTLAPPSYL